MLAALDLAPLYVLAFSLDRVYKGGFHNSVDNSKGIYHYSVYTCNVYTGGLDYILYTQCM